MTRAPLPTTIGEDARFVVERLLGSGDWAYVYGVRDRRRQSRVALKTLRRRSAADRARLTEEFATLQRLDHPNLARRIELFRERSEAFFTLELVEGQDLVSAVRSDAPRPRHPTSRDGSAVSPCSAAGIARLRRAMPQLVSGISALHGEGLVHHDLSRQNVRLAFDGRLVVLDYGLTADESTTHFTPTEVAGIPGYMAPEQHRLGGSSPASDWYSMGALLFEALTGGLPFAGDDHGVIVRKQTLDPPRPSALVAEVPSDLDELTWRLLQRDPTRRPDGAELQRRFSSPDPRGEPQH